MPEHIRGIPEVQKFLNEIRKLNEFKDNVRINNRPWAGNKVNKTLSYMAETGIRIEDIRSVLNELHVSNYSYTTDDRNVNFSGDDIWIFGITKNIVDKDEDFYIKLKIKTFKDKVLLIMSFHPEEPGTSKLRLKFPYKGYKEDI